MRLRIHVGAHRTGTTTLQSIIRENDAALSASGIKALTCWGAGDRTNPGLRNVTRMVEKASRRRGVLRFLKIREANRELRRQCGDDPCELLVLSDENLLGKPFSIPHGTALYPHSRRILTALASVLPASPESIHITVREYASFLTSAYAMSAVYSSNVPRFHEIKRALTRLERGWPDVLVDIQSSFPKSKITFSCYEETSVKTTLHAILGWDTTTLATDKSEKTINASPTVEAINASMLASSKTHGEADALIQQYAQGTKFDPFSETEKTQLRSRYERDLVALRSSTYSEVVSHAPQ